MSDRVRGLLWRAGVSTAFGALALWGVGAMRVADELADADVGLLVLALGVLALSFGLGAVRWWLLLRGEGIRLTLSAVVGYTWIGLFFANALPTGFGGDAVRGWMVGKQAQRTATVAATVLVDRLTAVWALMGLGLLGLVVDGGSLPSSVVVSLLLAAVLILGASIVLLTDRPATLLIRLARRKPRVERAVVQVALTLQSMRRRPGQLAVAVVISLAAQVLVAFAAWLLARALGMHVGPALLATTIPVALLATAAPVSVNGLGVREAVFRALLVPAGISGADAVAFSLATVVAGALVSLPGAIVWAAGKRTAREPLVASQPGVAPQPVAAENVIVP